MRCSHQFVTGIIYSNIQIYLLTFAFHTARDSKVKLFCLEESKCPSVSEIKAGVAKLRNVNQI